jgi:hypothetical protein
MHPAPFLVQLVTRILAFHRQWSYKRAIHMHWLDAIIDVLNCPGPVSEFFAYRETYHGRDSMQEIHFSRFLKAAQVQELIGSRAVWLVGEPAKREGLTRSLYPLSEDKSHQPRARTP